MPIFYEQAIRAGANGQPIDWLRPEHLADWKGLASALDRLTPEQRCDAVYADWLLQLHSPAHQALLQIRNLLIGQGALAANYLAELAQNADDAATGEGAEVRIVLDGDWLFVANNGRKISSLNLLGLSRFFVHAADQVRELNAETIGRFGIGFKSSYRIASEVLIYSWERNDTFTFRLPICREADLATHPNQERLNHLRTRLAAVGIADLDNAFRDVNSLGYCTPEFVSALPSQLDMRSAPLRQSKQGTIFCFHLRPDSLGEVQKRITGQTHEIYELCPLFLPKVRLVQLGPNALKMKVGQSDQANKLSNFVEADRITLTTSVPSQRDSHSRFWRLRERGESPIWQVALHTDSQHKLHLDREDDERGVSLKDGAAYAFFPLNAVSWPFRFHLHLKLPTNLARDNWNSADALEVENQLRRAIQCMADWLDTHFELLTGNGWSFEKLVEQRPTPMRNEGDWAARWANVVFEELRASAANKPLLRTFGGRRVRATAARRVAVIDRQAAAEAWSKLSSNPGLGDAFPVFVSEAAEVFDVEAAIPDEVGDAFAKILADPQFASEIRQAAMMAYLSTTRHSGGSLERALKGAVVELADHSTALACDLMTEPCGTELEPAWHECFKRLADWARDADWQSSHVFGQRVDEQFRKLSQAVFNPQWSQLSVKLGTPEAWHEHGEQFWNCSRRQCPSELRASVIACLRVPSGDGRWLPLSGIWLDDDTPVDCFAGRLAEWPLRYTDIERKRITGLLREWGLFEEWEQLTKKALSESLPGEITRRLAEQASADAFATVFSQAFQTARQPLDGGWAHIVNEAEKIAVNRFVLARTNEEKLSGKTALSASIAMTVRNALCLNDQLVLAPPWLTDAAHQRICRLGLQEKLGLDFMSQQEFTNRKEKLGRELLENFHRWPADSLNESQLKGIEELCSASSITRRRDWLVGLGPQKQRRLRDLILAGVSQEQTTDADKLKQKLLDQAEWRGEPLPDVLAKIPAFAEACIQSTKLELEAKLGTLTPLDREQLSPDILSLPEVCRLLETGDRKIFGSPQPLNVKWRYDGEVVATLDNAEFVIEADQFIVHQFHPPADENQCQRILSQFETYAVASADYEADVTLPPYERYQKHRDSIRRTLLKELVSKVGYEKYHILRELLQNAESAYASKRDRPAEAWFEFVVEKAGSAGRRKVSARHAGRAFNEPDSSGHERHDVERIWRLAAENERTPDEVGRFNRGFKTVFSVATNGSVRIRSGDFDFEVIDLLMLKPAEPKPNPSNHSPLTEFLFEAEYSHALEIFRIEASPGPATALPILNPSSFVFLGYLESVTVRFEQRVWQWRITRRVESNGWSQIAITTESTAQKESFLVFTGKAVQSKPSTPERRYAAAVRLAPNGLPIVLEKAWKKFHLTFETERDFPLDFLVNGDFEADQGRVTLQHIGRSGLVELAYDAILLRAQNEIRSKPTKEVWLAWARVLHLRLATTELEASNELRNLRQQASKAAEFFTRNIPHGGELIAVSELEFPTALFRRLAGLFGTSWGIGTSRWIDVEIAAALPDTEQRKHSFHAWLNGIAPEAPILLIIQRDLDSEKFTKQKLTGQEPDELKEARQVLAEKLRPVAPPPVPEVELPEVEAWTIANLWHWWERQGKPIGDYTLEGEENWRLFYTEDLSNTQLRRERLKQDLLAATSDSGKRIWYRLFSLACLMSAGRRVTELRDFWHRELEGRQFWKGTSGIAFGKGTDALFDDLMKHSFANLIASGESAYYWRRVFYDIRKIHKLVWEDEFAATLLLLVQAGRGGELLNFLKTGTLSGQANWVGVFGQSAGAPLFFLVRELCRLGVISDPQVQPLAFFVSTPVRRAMERIGWLPADSSDNPNFESLSSISSQLHAKLKGDQEFGAKLLLYYDIPLLHLGLNG